MVRVIWTREAADDLELIHAYIAEHDASAAHRLVERLVVAGESLRDFPGRGRRAGREHRVLSKVWPYLIVDRVETGAVRIVAVRHGARRPD